MPSALRKILNPAPINRERVNIHTDIPELMTDEELTWAIEGTLEFRRKIECLKQSKSILNHDLLP